MTIGLPPDRGGGADPQIGRRGWRPRAWIARAKARICPYNVSERGAKTPKRHQAVSGYWHTQTTLARWCRIRSYLDSAAPHGLTAFDAVTTALNGKPWLPLPAIETAA